MHEMPTFEKPGNDLEGKETVAMKSALDSVREVAGDLGEELRSGLEMSDEDIERVLAELGNE